MFATAHLLVRRTILRRETATAVALLSLAVLPSGCIDGVVIPAPVVDERVNGLAEVPPSVAHALSAALAAGRTTIIRDDIAEGGAILSGVATEAGDCSFDWCVLEPQCRESGEIALDEAATELPNRDPNAVIIYFQTTDPITVNTGATLGIVGVPGGAVAAEAPTPAAPTDYTLEIPLAPGEGLGGPIVVVAFRESDCGEAGITNHFQFAGMLTSAIPIASAWGMGVLLLSLLVAGTIVYRRKLHAA